MPKCKRKNFPHFIDQVGIELEGGFYRHREVQGSFHSDCSVVIGSSEISEMETSEYSVESCVRDRNCNCNNCIGDNWMEDDNEYENVVIGEFVSNPIDTWSKYTRWVYKHFPDIVNGTCGSHIHTSFNNLVYMSGMLECAEEICEILEKSYRSWGKSELNKAEWNRFSERLSGRNAYCYKGHNAASIIGANTWETYKDTNYGSTDRYKWLNFNSLEKHGTIELRLLPAFDTAEHMIEATNILFNVYRRVLYKYIRSNNIIHLDQFYSPNISTKFEHKTFEITHDTPQGVIESLNGITGNHLDIVEYGARVQQKNRFGCIGPSSGHYMDKIKRSKAKRGAKKKIKTPKTYRQERLFREYYDRSLWIDENPPVTGRCDLDSLN